MPAGFRIGPGLPADLPELQRIEREAGLLFAEVGMQAVADEEPPAIEELESYRTAGRLWVARSDDQAVGYALADTVDGHGHLAQLSVAPSHGRRGLGRALCAQVEEWARAQGLEAVTLTTFSDLAWNGPYYQRLGYRNMAEAEVGRGLRAIVADETRRGLWRWPRGCMIKPL
ncbi:MAG: GNAT family N-acetyltransferase [Acidimicrobiales bacterium]